VYLDRKPPFDPLPLSRTIVAANRQVTISGWGDNFSPTPTTGTGLNVQRTGTSRTLGSPTVADFHPEDPNAGLLVRRIAPRRSSSTAHRERKHVLRRLGSRC